MSEKRRATPRLTVGITTLAVVFSVLCLTIFAVLSLSTAATQKRLAERYADSVAAYYDADYEATLIAERFAGLSEAEALELAETLGLDATGDGEVCFTVPVDEARELSVRLLPGPEVKILSWRIVESGQWLPDEGLPIF